MQRTQPINSLMFNVKIQNYIGAFKYTPYLQHIYYHIFIIYLVLLNQVYNFYSGVLYNNK
jgi:hypothetical protein